MNRLSSFFIIMGSLILCACSHKATVENVTQRKVDEINSVPPVNALPQHLIYKMSGNYADLVPVTLDKNGNLVSYPDPVDVSESQKPVGLGDGWYLDRRGINEGTVFLDYTYDEYHKLPQVPDQATLKSHIKVKNGISIIWSCGTKRLSIDECKKLVKDGFPGCSCLLAEDVDN